MAGVTFANLDFSWVLEWDSLFAMSEKSAGKRKGALLAHLFDSVIDPECGLTAAGYDPAAVETALVRLRRLYGHGPGKYFRLRSAGWDNVPEAPVLLVANHSGGTSFPDAWGLAYSWYEHLGTARPISPLAHDMVFSVPFTAGPFSRLGALRARPKIGLKALTEWKRDLVVLPGGDVETWRPYKERYKVVWSGRKGYAKLALRAGVPIVPVACAGGHNTLMVLTDGRRFARRIGLHKLARSDIFPVHLSFPWIIGIGPLPHLPPPSTFRYLVGKPIYSDGPSPEPSTEAVSALDLSVRDQMQALLDRLRDGELKG